MSTKRAGPGPRQGKRARNVQPRHRDTYARRAKPRESVLCGGCGLVLSRGRWQWRARLSHDLRPGLCPACERVRDRFPAGTLVLDAPFLERRAEVTGMIRNVEAVEREEHPLERVMALEERGDRLVVTTTGLHLARRLASRLSRAFHRKPNLRYLPGEAAVQVDWQPQERAASRRRTQPGRAAASRSPR